MEIQPFTDQFELAAGLLGTSAPELRRRYEGEAVPAQRWLAIRDGNAVGAITARIRPDNRMFVTFACAEISAYGALTAAAGAALGRSLYTIADEDDRVAVVTLSAAGFATDLVGERFNIRFDKALARLSRVWTPAGFSVYGANAVDERRLFTLDNAIRNEVPDTEGWRGDRQWFHDEMSGAPPFDAGAYLVAVDDHNGEYAGLVRIWRNSAGPRLGLIGVLRQYRNTPIAAALLKQGLGAASEWGYETFTTETSISNTAIHSRLQRMDAEPAGRFLRLVRSPRAEAAA